MKPNTDTRKNTSPERQQPPTKGPIPETVEMPTGEINPPALDTGDTLPKEVKATIGVVTDCTNLYLREEPEARGKVLSILPALTEVEVDMDNSTNDFYKICTSTGVRGFCMKKYIAIRR